MGLGLRMTKTAGTWAQLKNAIVVLVSIFQIHAASDQLILCIIFPKQILFPKTTTIEDHLCQAASDITRKGNATITTNVSNANHDKWVKV